MTSETSTALQACLQVLERATTQGDVRLSRQDVLLLRDTLNTALTETRQLTAFLTLPARWEDAAAEQEDLWRIGASKSDGASLETCAAELRSLLTPTQNQQFPTRRILPGDQVRVIRAARSGSQKLVGETLPVERIDVHSGWFMIQGEHFDKTALERLSTPAQQG